MVPSLKPKPSRLGENLKNKHNAHLQVLAQVRLPRLG